MSGKQNDTRRGREHRSSKASWSTDGWMAARRDYDYEGHNLTAIIERKGLGHMVGQSLNSSLTQAIESPTH